MRVTELVDGGLYLIDKEVCRYDSWNGTFTGEHTYKAMLNEDDVVVNSKTASTYVVVKPMALTEDILVENGFAWDGEMQEFRLRERVTPSDSWRIEVYKFEGAFVANVYFGHSNWSSEVRTRVLFVHKLQNALKACDITRLANNFKATVYETD